MTTHKISIESLGQPPCPNFRPANHPRIKAPLFTENVPDEHGEDIPERLLVIPKGQKELPPAAESSISKRLLAIPRELNGDLDETKEKGQVVQGEADILLPRMGSKPNPIGPNPMALVRESPGIQGRPLKKTFLIVAAPPDKHHDQAMLQRTLTRNEKTPTRKRKNPTRNDESVERVDEKRKVEEERKVEMVRRTESVPPNPLMLGWKVRISKFRILLPRLPDPVITVPMGPADRIASRPLAAILER